MKLPSLRETPFNPTPEPDSYSSLSILQSYPSWLSLPLSLARSLALALDSPPLYNRWLLPEPRETVRTYILPALYIIHPHVAGHPVYTLCVHGPCTRQRDDFIAPFFPPPFLCAGAELLGDATKVMAPSETRNSTPRDTRDLWSVAWCLLFQVSFFLFFPSSFFLFTPLAWFLLYVLYSALRVRDFVVLWILARINDGCKNDGTWKVIILKNKGNFGTRDVENGNLLHLLHRKWTRLRSFVDNII